MLIGRRIHTDTGASGHFQFPPRHQPVQKKGWQSNKGQRKGNFNFADMPRRTPAIANSDTPPIEICILAGGRSTRMGRDKLRVQLAGRTLLSHAKLLARAVALPCRVITRDLVPRCGPLGGVITALRTTRARAVLFIPCDMPFISPTLLRRLQRRLPAFATHAGLVGFPFALTLDHLAAAEALRISGDWSLQSLAKSVRARRVGLAGKQAEQLANINTPDELIRAKAQLRPVGKSSRARGKSSGQRDVRA